MEDLAATAEDGVGVTFELGDPRVILVEGFLVGRGGTRDVVTFGVGLLDIVLLRAGFPLAFLAIPDGFAYSSGMTTFVGSKSVRCSAENHPFVSFSGAEVILRDSFFFSASVDWCFDSTGKLFFDTRGRGSCEGCLSFIGYDTGEVLDPPTAASSSANISSMIFEDEEADCVQAGSSSGSGILHASSRISSSI